MLQQTEADRGGGGADRPPSVLARRGLASRLLAAQAAVVLVGMATIWVVANWLGPSLFHDHMVEAGHDDPAEEAQHVEEAFAEASGVAQGVALIVALTVAVALSVLITRRMGRLVQGVAGAAATIATGDYAARVRSPGLGPGFDQLVGSFNQMAARLQDAERTRRTMLGDLAHELRTPIATLDAYLEAAEDGFAELDADTLAVLRHQTQRLARLADDIGAVSHAEEQLGLDRTVLDLDELVASAVTAAAPVAADAGVELVHRRQGALPDVDGDPDRLGQVLANLLDNAVRHTPAGGRVTVTTAPVQDRVHVQVTDTGRGIRAADLAHVTERFYRGGDGRNGAHGSGVGLTIAQAIVRAHHGDLRVDSPGEGRGTTVTWWLPSVKSL